jgi:hypothetical protein
MKMTTRSKAHPLSAVLLASSLVAGSATFATAQDDDHRLDEAWKDAVGDQEPILSEEQFAMLNNLAYQAAVTKVCDGYELDNAKFSQAIAEATAPHEGDMTEDQMKQRDAAVLIRFGTSYGLLLAEGNAQPQSFCESAAELKADTEVPNQWK